MHESNQERRCLRELEGEATDPRQQGAKIACSLQCMSLTECSRSLTSRDPWRWNLGLAWKWRSRSKAEAARLMHPPPCPPPRSVAAGTCLWDLALILQARTMCS